MGSAPKPKGRRPRDHDCAWIYDSDIDNEIDDRKIIRVNMLYGNPKEARSLAAWLLRAADWLDATAPPKPSKAKR